MAEREQGGDEVSEQELLNKQLVEATEQNNLKEICRLLEAGASQNARHVSGETVLMIACREGFESAVKELLKRRADVNMCDDYGWTPLLAAMQSGHNDIADMIIQAPVNFKNEHKLYKQNTEVIALADASWDHISMYPDELAFRRGDVIAITDCSDGEWWIGFVDSPSGPVDSPSGPVDSPSGLFPPSCVRLRVDEANELMSNRRVTFSIRQKPKLSQEQVRAKVIEEILSTEEVYVRHLRDVTEGYLKRCREKSTLFPPQVLRTVFSNIEEIYSFHCNFLTLLKESVVQEKVYNSCIGHCFMEKTGWFQRYSEYCNNHPNAVSQMTLLQADTHYKHFFEACRLLQEMDEISLEGYLLTPVQKICKYPLQLAELQKNTSSSHPDYKMVVQAQKTMASVAEGINERKRRNESLHKIAQWQVTIEEWNGEDVITRSSELIHSGEIYKISKGHSQERVFFLFDFQLIYCKKELLGGGLHYRGRLNMDECNVVPLQDGEVTHNVSPVLNAWKMNNVKKNKWYVLYTKSPDMKKKWLQAFKDERELITREKTDDLMVTGKKREDIMISARTKKPSSTKRKGKARVARSGADVPQSLGSPRSSAVVSPDKFPDSNGGKKQRNGSKGKLFGSRK